MLKSCLGVDFGTNELHLAVSGSSGIRCLHTEAIPQNLVREGRIVSPEAMAEVLKTALKAEKISIKNCALVLPPEQVFIRRTTMPYMTVSQLELNLPYEFHDYIQKDKDMYFYDYAVLDIMRDELGEPKSMELLTTAVSKDVIADYRRLLSKAGLRLTIALPEGFAYRNLIRAYEAKNPEKHPSEYCIVDLGHKAIRAHMFCGDAYDTTRAIECGGATVDDLIADQMEVDTQVAVGYKIANYSGAQELDSCQELYARIAVEILRAINFYSYNNPESNLQDIYFCGGLSRTPALIQAIRQTLTDLQLHDIRELMPPLTEDENAERCPTAVGVMLQ
ncbi:MAG: pilus assembly protein PilM [Oscillospiraceae bacterium]